MECRHQDFHTITSHYDDRTGQLVFFSACETCGVRLSEVYRLVYRPHFQPRRNGSLGASRRVAPSHPTVRAPFSATDPPFQLPA